MLFSWFTLASAYSGPPPTGSTGPLVAALSPLGYAGLDATAEQRREISAILANLAQSNPNPRPATDLDGGWELIYSDAPDVVGLARSGPLLRLLRVGQQIDKTEGTIANIIEFGPRSWLPLAAANAEGDRFQQRVLLKYEVDEGGTQCTLTLTGAGLAPKTLLGVSLDSVPPLKLEGPLGLPFGTFECLYNDGDVRVVRTAQGYYGVNQRLGPDENW